MTVKQDWLDVSERVRLCRGLFAGLQRVKGMRWASSFALLNKPFGRFRGPRHALLFWSWLPEYMLGPCATICPIPVPVQVRIWWQPTRHKSRTEYSGRNQLLTG